MCARRVPPISVLLLVSFAAASVTAQTARGTLTGRVVDYGGSPIPEAPVVLTNTATSQSQRVLTNSDGRYSVDLIAGRYEIAFLHPGSSSQVVTTVQVEAAKRHSANATLGTPADVDTGSDIPVRTPPDRISLLELQELPLINRNFTDLVALLPGISSDLPDEVPFGANGPLRLSIAGTRSSAITWTLDGTSIAHPGRASGIVVSPSLDAIGGVDVHTGMYGASERSGGGGVVGIVTRAGSDRVSGSAYDFVRNDALRSSAFATKRGDLGREYTRTNPRLRYNNAGFTIGGPALPGGRRAFFFVSEEWRHRSSEPISALSKVPDPAWLSDPASPHFVPPEERDPHAVKLLAAWPSPNVPGTNLYSKTYGTPDDTRQDVVRLDLTQTAAWRWTGRYVRDRNTTFHPGGYLASPNLIRFNAETDLNVIGSVGGIEAQGVWSRLLARLSYQLVDHRPATSLRKGLTNTRGAFGITIPELFPSNTGNRIPSIQIQGVMGTFTPQPIALHYREHEVHGEVIVERGPHTIRSGALVAVEDEEEDSNCQGSPGVFFFSSGGGFTGFQNFIRGNRDGACGTGCMYIEDQVELTNRFRLGRYELYAQDTWRLRAGLTIDLGLRYSLYPPITDDFNRLLTFSPRIYDPAAAPSFADPYGWETVPGTGNPLNGLYLAGQTSPYGRAIYAWDRNNLQPRLAASWTPGADDRVVVRAGYGVYYDRPSAGLFAVANLDPAFAPQIALSNPQLSNPAAGVPYYSTANYISSRPSISDPFLTPRTERWNVGLSRRLYGRGLVEIGYVGTRGRHQIRSIDINQPQLDVSREEGSVNLVRPYPGYDSIVMRETTGRSRYDGLLASFRHRGGRAGSVTANYTLSRSTADASCECTDLPQNPLDKDANYSTAQTDRTHVLNVFYVYELPFFRDHRRWLARVALSGWQVAGITRISSGPPARVSYWELGSSIPRRADLVGDPAAGKQTFPYWFDPTAFAPPAAGAYGNAPVSPFRLPGRHQWDMTISKNFSLSSKTRLQVRADIINVFNHTQYLGVRTVCSGESCESPWTEFGRVASAHAPRQAQLGVKLYW